MGICRWEWFDFRRLPFEDAFLSRRTGRSRSRSRRKQEEKVAKITFSIGFRSYIRECLGAILMLFRPSLPWGFAAGSGSILGDCLLKMPF